ncbi:hypothetical protein VDG1235_3618 [Verrucomicrobiia bacterium DG1235]|nr:hypothetical protein VDG1235_863 [Verrucomicrobiae bacterium DG1235]EDY83991.1 hypothetical protein VDG1235_3618 [Verrucomicrobiae bacterium DG1235]
MKEKKNEVIEYFKTEYLKMLEENLDDYISQFDDYMEVNKK